MTFITIGLILIVLSSIFLLTLVIYEARRNKYNNKNNNTNNTMIIAYSPLVVTRHPALIQYLKEVGLIDDTTPVIEHATVAAVKNKDVIGVIPLWLACHTYSVTEVPLTLTQEQRGKELTIEEVRKAAGIIQCYVVNRRDVPSKSPRTCRLARNPATG